MEAAINAATTAGLNTQLLPQAPTAGFRCAGSRMRMEALHGSRNQIIGYPVLFSFQFDKCYLQMG